MNPGSWLLLGALLLWCVAVIGAARRAAHALAAGNRSVTGVRRWAPRWGAAISQSRWQAVNLRAMRRLYVALSCGATLPVALALVIAVESNAVLRRALRLRLAALQRRAVGGGLPRPARPTRPAALPLLRHLDLLVEGALSRRQLLVDWRIELLCSRLASPRVASPRLASSRVASSRDYDERCADPKTTDPPAARTTTNSVAASAAGPDCWLQ